MHDDDDDDDDNVYTTCIQLVVSYDDDVYMCTCFFTLSLCVQCTFS